MQEKIINYLSFSSALTQRNKEPFLVVLFWSEKISICKIYFSSFQIQYTAFPIANNFIYIHYYYVVFGLQTKFALFWSLTSCILSQPLHSLLTTLRHICSFSRRCIHLAEVHWQKKVQKQVRSSCLRMQHLSQKSNKPRKRYYLPAGWANPIIL